MTARRGRGRAPARAHSGPPVLDVYARISRARPGQEGRSVAGQVADCLREVDARGATVGEVWRDESLSAWNPAVTRPQWDALMTRLESGAADGVCVYDLTRFSRKVMEGERLVTLADKGVLVWSVYSSYDLTSADGKADFRGAMKDAAKESDKISERTSRGKRLKAQRGKLNAVHRGFGMPGYLPNPRRDDGKPWEPGDPRIPAPDEQVAAERDALREVARRLLAGESWAQMVRYLNGTGLRTVAGNPWTSESLRNSLRRPALAGIAEHRGEEVGTLAGEPVLPREVWQRCQSAMDAKTRGRKPSDAYLLTNLLRCGRCGHPLTGRPRMGRTPYPDGETAREYWCQKRADRAPDDPRNGCGRLTVDQRFADEVVTAAVLRRLSDPRNATRLAARAAMTAVTREKITREVDRLEGDADALAGKTATWGLARVDAALGPIHARLAVLRDALARLDAPETTATATTDTLATWQGATVAQRREMIRRAFPDGITVAPATSRGRGAREVSRFAFGRGAP